MEKFGVSFVGFMVIMGADGPDSQHQPDDKAQSKNQEGKTGDNVQNGGKDTGKDSALNKEGNTGQQNG